MGFSHAMVLEKVVEHTDHCIGPLPCVAGFIDEVIDRPRDGFTKYPKDSAFPRSRNRWGQAGEGQKGSGPVEPC